MKMVNYISNMHSLMQALIKPALFFIIIGLIIIISKRVTKNRIFQRLNFLDSFPIIGIWIVHVITMTNHGFSFLPVFVLIWMIMGIIFLIYRVVSEGQLRPKLFLINFWRASDIYWIIIFILSLIIKIITIH
ncbi:hypothetical protein IV48_GL000506 [Fructilactobacillus fructivorans]|uniref:DUF3397 family protein n=2 Tax=Fructilactobacillus fructivorans TaxID=1614 RepID=A0AAE6P1U8_9LACO|nr:hypothetical protein FC73_GL000386 [Fructilactobacillus fructivorans]KRN13742.1 hypothetical protein IV37_GL000467 [Fructilactobacillus fructivorans]KRN39556.1 hypothetical protein IV51_GL000923 [Fructilactobacillus fructivorans]KRN43275.1 hypothetical protein IV48_GL000506 [Fructilactobacillus fructivorans]QFX92822.1 DUF3397 family protein [Fructilactobacillus fructivorans]